MPRDDKVLLLDMLIAAKKIESFTKDMTENEFMKNELVQSAVIREFQVLGEAARMMSGEGKSIYSQIPWTVIVGMRNHLIHQYFRIELSVVWNTIQNNIPSLIGILENVVSTDDSEK